MEEKESLHRQFSGGREEKILLANTRLIGRDGGVMKRRPPLLVKLNSRPAHGLGVHHYLTCCILAVALTLGAIFASYEGRAARASCACPKPTQTTQYAKQSPAEEADD